MKTKVIKTILAILILCGGYPVQADVVWTEGYHEINTGDIIHEHVSIYNDVHLNIYGGGCGYLETFNTTITNWYNGEINYLLTNDNSIVNIYGGELDIGLGASNNSQINLYAYDVVYHPTGGHWDVGWLEGKYLLTDRYFDFDLWGQETYSHIDIVPEPATLFLLGLGGLLLRKSI